MGEKGEGVRSTAWLLQNSHGDVKTWLLQSSHGDVKCSIGDTVSDILIFCVVSGGN